MGEENNRVDTLTLSCVAGGDVGKIIVLGNRRNLNNTVGWDKVVLYLPVTISYDLQRPWFYMESRYGLIVADFFVYVDDGRPIGST